MQDVHAAVFHKIKANGEQGLSYFKNDKKIQIKVPMKKSMSVHYIPHLLKPYNSFGLKFDENYDRIFISGELSINLVLLCLLWLLYNN